MTIWDKIYKDYKKGGKAWATLGDRVDPQFIEFVRRSEFPIRSALDIGCGTGQYLQFLGAEGFKLAGVDNSETAIAMSYEAVGKEADIKLADMYDFAIPKDEYDLIFSVATIHHGTKNQVKKAVHRIYDALMTHGKIFITLPSFDSSNSWNTFADKHEVAPGTYVPQSGPEQGLPHSFFTETEVKALFNNFSHVKITLDKIGRWKITAEKL